METSQQPNEEEVRPQSPSTNQDDKPIDSEKGNDADHGNRFQSKLLVLFFLRAIKKNYDFYLATELPDQGVKFDDLIFKYRKKGNKEGDWCYQYLQAKHKMYENKFTKIKENQMLEDVGDFSVPKYFCSFLELKRRGDKIENCVICTNADVDRTLVTALQDDAKPEMLVFKECVKQNTKKPTCYKLTDTTQVRDKLKLKDHSISHVLAEKLRDCATKNKPLNAKDEKFRNYHMALAKEIICIDSKLNTATFHQDFIDDVKCVDLSEGAKELRRILVGPNNDRSWKKWTFKVKDEFGVSGVKPDEFNYELPDEVKDDEIDDFFNKFIFAANTPNEDELTEVLENEVGDHLKLTKTDFQSAYLFVRIVDWFKKKKNKWLSTDEGKEILAELNESMDSFRATSFSLDFKQELKGILSFDPSAINQIADGEIRQFIDSFTSEKLVITSLSPKFTAVKVIAAIESISMQFESDDSFLVTSSSRLEKGGHEKDWMKKTLLGKGNPQQLLIFVNDNESQMQTIESDNNKEFMFSQSESRYLKGKKFIVIDKDNKTNSKLLLEDAITYAQLKDETKENLMSNKISFQGNDATVRDLIGDGQSDKVFDFQSMEEFLLAEEKERKSIPSHNSSQFEKSFYIKRKLTFDFEFNWNKIAEAINKAKWENERKTTAEELRVQHGDKMKQGNVEWIKGLEENVKWTIWREILKTRNANEETTEDNLINEENWEKRRAVIIKGVAGTGKSTVLSHYYDAIKEKDPNVWVIRIDLKDHFTSLAEFRENTDLSGAIDFIASVADIQSNFGRSLLKHRLETGDRIVLMFDGFDEIDFDYKQITIEMITSITEGTSTRLYVTTRPDVADNLQFQLGQLAYTLVNFSEEVQIQCLSSFWIEKIGSVKDEEIKQIREIADLLVKRITKDLKDEEKSFVGVPLQCRIVAECFLDEVQKDIGDLRKGNGNQLKIIGQHQKFDLVSLYRKLMEKKRQVFREEKVVKELVNHIAANSIEQTIEDTENHLSKLAVQTIISDGKKVDILWPKQYGSKSKGQQRMEKMDELCVRFGLVDRVDNKLEFLHRTYAEYLLADYLFQGFKLEDDDHNGLMENESAQLLIGEEILVDDQYSGVRIFLNSMLKDIIDSDKWRQIEGAATLPDRLMKFVDQFPPSACVNAGENKNSNIFVFLFDCLQATSNQQKIQQVVEFAFHEDFRFDIYYQQSSQVFERLIKYFNIEDEDKVKLILEEMLRDSKLLRCDDWIPRAPDPDPEERKKVLKLVLDFMEKAKEKGTLKKFLNPKRETANFDVAIYFLIWQDGYEEHLIQYLQILFNVYPAKNEAWLLDFFTNFFCRIIIEDSGIDCRKGISGKTQKALIILRDLGRKELVTSRISRLVLKRDPVSFDDFYQPKKATEAEEMDDSLLERDSARMTRLHRAIYYNQTEIVEKIFNWVIDNKKNSKVTERIVDCVARDDYKLTPFYVAFARGNKELCEKIMKFLCQVLAGDELKKYLEDENGFLKCALFESLEFNEIEMLQFILTKGKEIFGKELLFECVLLMSKNSVACERVICQKECYEIIQNFIIDENHNDDYKKLNDFVFLGVDRPTKMLTNCVTAETVEKMIAADGGIRNWLKRFLTVFEEFGCFSKLIENKKIELNDEVREQLAQFTISFVKETTEKEEIYERIKHPIEYASIRVRSNKQVKNLFELMGEERVRKLLLDNGGETIKRFIARWKWDEKDEFLYFIESYLNRFDGNDIANNILKFMNR